MASDSPQKKTSSSSARPTPGVRGTNATPSPKKLKAEARSLRSQAAKLLAEATRLDRLAAQEAAAAAKAPAKRTATAGVGKAPAAKAPAKATAKKAKTTTKTATATKTRRVYRPPIVKPAPRKQT